MQKVMNKYKTYSDIIMSCFVCCEKYNKTTREKIVCSFSNCNYECCKSCIRTYILGSTKDPHCMNCNNRYTQNFIITNLNRSFHETEYKQHRKCLLTDIEISKMPETMQIAENYKQIESHEINVTNLTDKIKILKQELANLTNERNDEIRKIQNLRSGKLDETQEKKRFIFPCPDNECRGYLSTQYKCELCKLYTCPDCFEIIGHNKNDPHTCNPDNIASAEEIRKTSKACPNCGVRIQKISGCDQMYCTECKIAFSWNTGKIDNGPVHNPHFYQLMAKQNNGQAPRNPQDVLCGGLINYYQVGLIRRTIANILDTFRKEEDTLPSIDTQLLTLHRLANHITYYELPRFRTRITTLSDNLELRVKYLNNKISKQELSNQIYKNDNMRKKTIEILQIYELLSVYTIENFANIANNKPKIGKDKISKDKKKYIEYIETIRRFIDEFKQLIKYTNYEMKLISITYNHRVQIIDDDFNWIMIKITKSQLTDIMNEQISFSKVNKSNTTSGEGCSTDPL